MPMQHPVKAGEELQDIETYIEPFLGWRCWAVKADTNDVWLESITYSSKWVPEEKFVARCLTTCGDPKESTDFPHKTPCVDCGCGIYSVKDIYDAQKWMDQRWMSLYTNPKTMRCMGEVSLWGRVLRFTKGYLAEYAYPKTILVPHDVIDGFIIDAHEVVHELRKRYKGIEVRLL